MADEERGAEGRSAGGSRDKYRDNDDMRDPLSGRLYTAAPRPAVCRRHPTSAPTAEMTSAFPS